MKSTTSLFLLFLIAGFAQAQPIKKVADQKVLGSSIDSMNLIYQFKIVPYVDSGVLVYGYADSALDNQTRRNRQVIKAFDKNLKLLWTIILPFQDITGGMSACYDDSGYTYFCYFSASDDQFRLLKIDASGNSAYDKIITNSIQGVPLVNEIQWKRGRLFVYGGDFYTQTSFSPFILTLNRSGQKTAAFFLGTHVSADYSANYFCKNLIVMDNGDIICQFPKDDKDSFSIVCLDSNFQEKWKHNFFTEMDYTFNFFRQKDFVCFAYGLNNSFVSYILKLRASTGEVVVDTKNSINLNGMFSNFTLPAYNGNYLNFGNYGTVGGFDLAVDYFDGVKQIYTAFPSSINLKDGVSDACVLGQDFYVVSIEFVDKYTDPNNYIWRGIVHLRKYHSSLPGWNSGLSAVDINRVGSVYPNPFTEYLMFPNTSWKAASDVEVYNMSGQIVDMQIEETSSGFQINTRAWSKGLYFIRNVQTGETFKVVKG